MTSRQRSADPRVSAFLLGAATVIAQALLVREAMAAMGGSEISWGVVMALWLTGMALGATAGVKFGSPQLPEILPIAVLILAGTGTVLLRASPAIIGAAPGETVAVASALWLWVLAILPSAFAGGLAFPLLAGAMGAAGGGRAYAYEAAGALVGGIVLTISIIFIGTAGALCLGIGTIAAATAWRRRSITLTVMAIVFFISTIPASGILARAAWTWSGNPGELHRSVETRYQQLTFSSGPPTSVYGDSKLIASYPDPYTVLPRSHLLMLLHPNPHRVLAVGCVVDGAVEALSLHPFDQLTIVEQDPGLLKNLSEIYGAEMTQALDQPGVQVVTDDPVRALEMDDGWDMIIILGENPSTLRQNRTRTLEFLRRCRDHLQPDGVLVMNVGISDTYLGGFGGRLLSVLSATLRNVFDDVAMIPGEQVLLLAGGLESGITLDHEILLERLERSGLAGSGLIPEMLPLLVDSDRASDLAAGLPVGGEPNTISHPRAVLLAGALHEGRVFPGLLPSIAALERVGRRPLIAAIGTAILALLAVAPFRRLGAGGAAAAVGFCSMGWWLLLIASWQSTRGTIYSEIGALSAIFMAGLAVGALAANRLQRPERILSLVLSAGVLLSIVLAVGFALVAPGFLVPVLLAVAGAATGGAFPGLSRLGSRDSRRSAGIAFSADEAGAAAAAIAVGIVAIPWAGLTATAWGLAALQIGAIPAVVLAVRSRSRS